MECSQFRLVEININEINTVKIYNMIGNIVLIKNISNNQSILNIEKFNRWCLFDRDKIK